MLKRLLLPVVMLCASVTAVAQGDQNWQEGTHYDVITPAIRTANPDKIEVAEFFWYGCGHCYTFEPLIGQWKKTLAEDVEFRGSPAIWNQQMELHARAYYAADVLGVLDTMNLVVFQAMNVDGRRLSSEEEIAAMRLLKRSLDPKNLLNPGRVLALEPLSQ